MRNGTFSALDSSKSFERVACSLAATSQTRFMTRFLSRALMLRVSRNQLEVLAERRRRLEVRLVPAQDHALAADVLEDVQDPRQVLQRVGAARR